MPKTSPFAVVERGQLHQIACRLRLRMYELGLTGEKLADAYNSLMRQHTEEQEGEGNRRSADAVPNSLMAARSHPGPTDGRNRCDERSLSRIEPRGSSADRAFSMTRDRIAKILMNCQRHPRKSAARVISCREIIGLARALKVSPEWLLGQEDNPDPIIWDALAHSHRAEEILHLLNHYEDRTGRAIVWADRLMCSLTTPEFVHASHEALFAELEEIGLKHRKQGLVEVYDRIGHVRRARRMERGRSSRFTQLMVLSDLEKISRGRDEYRGISRAIRQSCLENARALIERSACGIELIVAEDDRVRELVMALRDFESVGVCGDEFALMRAHSGDVIWSENKNYVRRYVQLLDDFRDRARYRNRDQVLRLLDGLLASMR